LNLPVGLVIAGHGSADKEALKEFSSLIRMIETAHAGIVESGYLEFERPTIQEAIDRAVAKGAASLVVLPAMLSAARHVKQDIPNEINAAKKRYPHVAFTYGKTLDCHPKTVLLCRERIHQAISEMGSMDQKEIALLIVGQGTSDPEATALLEQRTASLSDGLGLGWAVSCYAGVASPLLSDALDQARQKPCRGVVLFPYFLFAGVLVKKITRIANAFQQENPQLRVKVASHVGPDPQVRDIFLDYFIRRGT
jgi:precorrin-8X/cobalt-precorrin-8 methylmutase